MNPSPYKALFYSLICALLFGSAFPAIKTVYQDWEARGVDVTLSCIWLFAGIRFMIAGAGLLFVAKQPIKELKVTPWKLLLLFALGQSFLQYMLFYIGVHVSSGSLAALLTGSGSLWWMIMAPLLVKSPWPNKYQWVAVIVGFIGVIMAVYSPGSGATNPVLGGALILGATLSGSIGIIVFGKIKPTMGSKAATGFSLLLGGFLLSIIGSPALSSLPDLMSEKVIYLTLWLSLVSGLAFAIWNHLSTIYPVSLLASYRFLIPLCGVIESLIILKSESPGIGLLIGGTLILSSMFFAQKLQNSKT